MNCQKHLFNLDTDVTYLNGAYMSPILKSSELAGIQGIQRKRTPSNLKVEDFFESVNRIRERFARLINADQPNRIVVMPSASYGFANVAQNIPKTKMSKILILHDQFPSNYYIWQNVASHRKMNLCIVKREDESQDWNEVFLKAIDENTAVVSMSIVHWGDGTRFDIKSIGEKARQVGALFVIDGTQSIGALPFDLMKTPVNALVCSSYKWLLGPYGLSIAYYDVSFDNGSPIEESWLNRIDSHDFQYLTNYQPEYRNGARRYEVGEAPDFIKLPMLEASLDQLLEWTPKSIQKYCGTIVKPILEPLRNAGFRIIDDGDMAFHLFGIRLPAHIKMEQVKAHLASQNIVVSYRQDAIRISPNVYNDKSELEKLKSALIHLSNK